MSAPKYVVALEQSTETELNKIVRSGTHSARTIIRARVLLMANETHGTGKTDQEICALLHLARDTTQHIRKHFVHGGLDRALFDAPRPGQPKHFSPSDEVTVTAIACTEVPAGHDHWTLALLQEEAMKRMKKKIGKTTVGRILLKNDLHPHLKKNVVYSGHHR